MAEFSRVEEFDEEELIRQAVARTAATEAAAATLLLLKIHRMDLRKMHLKLRPQLKPRMFQKA